VSTDTPREEIEKWLQENAAQWVHQTEREGIRILYHGKKHNRKWRTQITKQDEANKFMMTKNHPTRIDGPYQSEKKVYLGRDLYHFVDNPQPWQQEFLDIMNAGVPGIWYMQWYRIGKWEKFLEWMNLIEVHFFHSSTSVKKSIRYSPPHHVMIIHLFEASNNRNRVQAIKLAKEIATGQITYRGHTIKFPFPPVIFLCSERPCPKPHEGITFMTISDDGQHLIPATDYDSESAPPRPGL
jgi:hypothetical protein